ncbi:hypothetical protein EMGBS15_07880 [Filimonas sp.]|nr:hypothetical protein EMGBS15_07880 [Filimonas sp.]
METKKIPQADILDIIFDERNKSYGAYELRRNYHKRARKAVVVSLVFALVAISAPLIAGYLSVDPDIVLTGPKGPTILTDIPLVPPPKVPVAKPPHTETTAKTNHKPTVIVKATDPVEPKPDPKEPFVPSGPSGPQTPEGPAIAVNPGGGGGGPHILVVVEPVLPEKTFDEETVEQRPEFPGGDDALMAYLKDHIQYPKRAVESDAQGKVVLGFVVNKDGEIDEVTVVRPLGYGCDEEAMRVVGSMPKWKPGKNNGKAVKVYFNLPIQFEIE